MHAAMNASFIWRKSGSLRAQGMTCQHSCHFHAIQPPQLTSCNNKSSSSSGSSQRHVSLQSLDRRRVNLGWSPSKGGCCHGKANRHETVCHNSAAGTAGSLSSDASNPDSWSSAAQPRKDWKQVLSSAVSSLPLGWMFMFSYIALLLVVPITAMLTKASAIPWQVFIARATEPVAMHAYFVTFTMALFACLINCVFGFILAWVLVKYNFPGKKWLDAAVDLPFALPTSVAGLTLSSVYSEEGILGQFLVPMGVDVVFSRLGVAIAMVFVSFPFVVRTMQPVIQELDQAQVEAAWTLGASSWRTFLDVIFPPLIPALMTGTALAFSRALGEFGSVVIISSNFPFKDLIAPVLIFQSLEQYDFVGATVIGTVLLLASLVIMLCINKLQAWVRK